jgi:hypothetical protein
MNHEELQEIFDRIERVTRERVEQSPVGKLIMESTHLSELEKIIKLGPVYQQMSAVVRKEILKAEGVKL